MARETNQLLDPMFHKIGFGRPIFCDQALNRLPDRSHKLFAGDEVIQGLVFLKEVIQETRENRRYIFEKRFVHFNFEIMREMERISFKRDKSLFTESWSFVDEDLDPWGELLPTGDNEYQYWQVSTLTPDSIIGGMKLISIEMNPTPFPKPISSLTRRDSEFFVGLAYEKEIKQLVDNMCNNSADKH